MTTSGTYRKTFISVAMLLPLFILPLLIVQWVVDAETTGRDGEQAAGQSSTYAIAVHGGAGSIPKSMPDSTRKIYESAMEEALTIGEEKLKDGASALDAIEQVIRYLENHPRFNAGKGAVLTSKGKHELDAAIMDGSTRAAGAITGIRTVKNPITLARKVMNQSRHILFSADGAEAFADQTGVERVQNSYFTTPRRKESWKRAKERYEGQSYRNSSGPDAPKRIYKDLPLGTVGCVALDKDGKLAAGTSTGGLTYKEYGRVGDVPIIGAGTYADSVVAVSATGIGEEIMRNLSGFHVSSYMQYAEASLSEAADHVIHTRMNEGEAGLISVDSKGNIHMPFNTNGMYRAAANSKGVRKVAIW